MQETLETKRTAGSESIWRAAASIGLIPPTDGCLAALRSLCDEHEALLVYDETTTGLRLGLGGAAKLYCITPDLSCLGGCLASGFPLAAVGGRQELLRDTKVVEWSVGRSLPPVSLAGEQPVLGLAPSLVGPGHPHELAAATATLQVTG